MAEESRLSARRRFVGFALFFLTFLLVQSGSPLSQTHKQNKDAEPLNVGMVALLAAPQRYEGKLIRSIGFLCIEFENDALYLHEEDYRYGEGKNSFSLRLSETQRKQFKSLSLKRVIIEARVYANGPEAREWAGALGNIQRLEPWVVDRGPVPQP